MTEQEIQIKLELTLAEVNVIMVALGKQPYETVAPLVTELRAQTYPQLPSSKDTLE
jgi:hypothetical protein